MKASLITLLAAALLGAGTAQAQNEYAEIARLRGMNQTVRGIRSMADGEHYTTLEGSNIIRHSYAAAGPGERMLPSSAANLTITDYSFSPDERQILIASGAKPIYRHSYTTSYFLAAGNSLTPVLREAEAPRDASFSPDSRLIAYSDRNDLYVYDTAARQTRRITDDGAWNSVINGTTDWVYEEEFGFTKAYAFSPDSRRIAYLRFDESQVPLMEMMRFDGKLYNQAYSFKYPKAGERNSTDKQLQRVNKRSMEATDNKDVLTTFPEIGLQNNTVLILKKPKTRASIRKIFLPKTVAENLTKWKMEQDLLIEQLGAEYHDYNLVIAGSRGQPVESNIIRKSMRQLIEANELPQVCFHSLRHSSITYKLKLNGGDIKAVQGDSGHAQATMVTDQYSHILDESRRNNAQLFEQAFYGGKGVKIVPEAQDKAVEEQVQQAGLNSEVLLKIFSNPDMVAMLKMLAKTLG